MGIPQHYSRELPSRCLHLIDELWPHVEGTTAPGQPHLGPLTTTFLLAMATPILTLPIERIERRRSKGRIDQDYVNDREIDVELAAEIDRVIGGASFEQAPFFAPGVWRYASIPFSSDLNLATYFPQSLSEALADDAAMMQAEQLETASWASCLRNALAHGAVAYLDRNGFQTHGNGSAHFLAFASAKLNKDRTATEAIRVLRIAETDFREFLRRWVEWLNMSGLSQALAA